MTHAVYVICLYRHAKASCSRSAWSGGYLPPVTILHPAVLVPGPWCFAFPLWGNPVLPCAAGLAAGGLERDFPALMALPGMLTLGTAVRCWEALAAYKRSVLRTILRITDLARVPPELQSGPDAAGPCTGGVEEPGVAAWRG
eukprot:XP_001695170.1 predicted protein [Chlamydomonas reinhardtii]